MICHFKYTQQALIRHAHTRILKNQETPVEKNITRRKMHGKNECLVLYTKYFIDRYSRLSKLLRALLLKYLTFSNDLLLSDFLPTVFFKKKKIIYVHFSYKIVYCYFRQLAIR